MSWPGLPARSASLCKHVLVNLLWLQRRKMLRRQRRQLERLEAEALRRCCLLLLLLPLLPPLCRRCCLLHLEQVQQAAGVGLEQVHGELQG